MSKILIVPDVHGRKFWHKAEELIDEVDLVVFLGDYLDPYPHEGITFDDAIEELGSILEFKEKYSDKVTLLVGNHDMHYIVREFMDCSRLNEDYRLVMHDFFMNNIDKFQLVHEIGNYLFSHAGVYDEWLTSNNLSLEELNDFTSFIQEKWRTLEDISWYRGGYNQVGSCVWADLRESLKHEPLHAKRHIVGHTQLESKPYISDKIVCLDARRCFILDTLTGNFCDA
jgi:hypothetical protein